MAAPRLLPALLPVEAPGEPVAAAAWAAVEEWVEAEAWAEAVAWVVVAARAEGAGEAQAAADVGDQASKGGLNENSGNVYGRGPRRGT